MDHTAKTVTHGITYEPKPKISTAAKPEAEERGDNLQWLFMVAVKGGNITDQIDESETNEIAQDAVSRFEADRGANEAWRTVAERGLRQAALETEDDGERKGPWDDSANVDWPLIAQAAQQWAARAYPEIVKSDQVVGVKVFEKPNSPGPQEVAKALGAADPVDQQATQQKEAALDAEELAADEREARAKRVQYFMNWIIFYKMKSWEDDTDALLNQLPVTGSGFKKVYYDADGVKSEYISPLQLIVDPETRSLDRCPRITHVFELYPYEIKEKIAQGIYNDFEMQISEDEVEEERPREIIEQHTYLDLDYDGFPEPYIVTVDVETASCLSIVPAFDDRDIKLSPDGKVQQINRWLPFPDFQFMIDPRGKFYGLGYAGLLYQISQTINSSLNQMLDAASAQIKGGGFIASSLTIQGSGAGGDVFFEPGTYQTVKLNGASIQDQIYERPLPQPSPVTMQMMTLLLDAGKEIASVKDVITGSSPATAPVGTTLALQQQALVVFSATYKRIYRGFKKEFQTIYRALQKWATPEERAQYASLTGGKFEEDFASDGTDIMPVADPSVVTKAQKVSRIQALMQLAESPIGQAAGMTQAAAAQELILEALQSLDIERPERFIGQVQPNPELMAKVQEAQANSQLKQAQAAKAQAEIPLSRAKAVREAGLAAKDAHDLHIEAGRVDQQGLMPQEEAINGTSDTSGGFGAMPNNY